MRIEHVAVYVNDLEKTKEFYQKYFGAKSNDIYHNINTGFKSYFLTFDDGARLEIMTAPELVQKSDALKRTGFIHLAFTLGCKQKVDELTKQLQNDGFIVTSGPRTTGDGYYESCILDHEGNLIEITA